MSEEREAITLEGKKEKKRWRRTVWEIRKSDTESWLAVVMPKKLAKYEQNHCILLHYNKYHYMKARHW